jgi:plasmid stabilization system protein ParE
MQVVFTVQAEQDLEEIGDYIAIDNPFLFQPSDTDVLIVRVLHGARDLPALL